MRSVSRCGVCGAFGQPGDRFCWSCGSELKRAAPAPERRPAQSIVESDPETELTIRRAHLARQRGRLEEAEGLLRGVLERAPSDVSALSMLSEILRAKGDLVGSVAAAQRATEAAADGSAPPGAVAQARAERAKIEASVVRQLAGQPGGGTNPMSLLMSGGVIWYRSRYFYLALAALGLGALFLALVAALRGQLLGYTWFAVSLFGAGWCYNDAETRRQAGLFWGPLILCLGPFGLAVYFLATY